MSLRRLVLIATLVLLAPACVHPLAQSALSRPTDASLAQDLGALVTSGEIPGATVIVTRGERALADVTVGYADIDARRPLGRGAIFRLYSMSKPITSVGIMMLAERGALTLSDPVARYLPELTDVQVYAGGSVGDMKTVAAARPITIEDLLLHRSGITYHFTGNTPVHRYYRKHGVMRDTPVGRLPGDGAPAPNLDELVRRIGKAPLLHQPGEAFAYSYSTTVLGAVIERITGARLDEWLDREIFQPLGMKDSGFFITDRALSRFVTGYSAGANGLTVIEPPESSDYRDRNRLLDGGGALAGTADDYLRFAQMLANGGTLAGRRLLSEASVDAMMVSRLGIGGMGPQQTQFGYGFSIGDAGSEAGGLQPANTASWSGSANTYFYIDRRRRAVALLMTHVLSGTDQTLTPRLRQIVNRHAERLIGP